MPGAGDSRDSIEAEPEEEPVPLNDSLLAALLELAASAERNRALSLANRHLDDDDAVDG
jgi:hypothetical protein